MAHIVMYTVVLWWVDLEAHLNLVKLFTSDVNV